MNWTSISWGASGLLIGSVTAPLIIWWQPQMSLSPPAPQLSPSVAVIVPIAPPEPEARSVPWFVDHQSEIAPARARCADNVPGSAAAAAECSNADRASLHVFNQQLRAKYFGGK